ncbi:general substrate transporter [Aspergillus insuetus]
MKKTKPTNAAMDTLLSAIPHDGRPWYRVPHLLHLNCLIFGMLLFSATVGYDTALMNGLQSIAQWQTFMERPTGAWLGFIGAIQSVGGLVAMPLQAWCSNRFGRKSCIWVGYVFIIIGVAMQAAASTPTLFIVSRVFIGHSCAWFQSAAILVTELAYPSHRSKLVAMYNCMFYVGSSLAAWVTFGCRNMGSSWSWRIPVLLQIAFPLISLPVTFLCPESPRWLLRNNRRDEAVRVLTMYHAGGDEAAPIVSLQMQEMTDSIRQEDEVGKSTRWIHMVKTKGNRHRLHISVTLGIAAQWNGQGVVSYYLNLILNTIGITSATDQTLINACLQVWNIIFAAIGSLLVDRAGRRLLFLISTIIMLVSYICLTGLAGGFNMTGVSAVGTAVIPFLFIYYAGYDLAYTPLLIAYPAEIWPYPLRSKGVALTYMCTYAALLFNQFVNPIAMDSIGWKYYIVYIAILVVILVNVWFTYPETRGHSLEEVAVVFDDLDRVGTAETKASEMGAADHREDVQAFKES